MDRTDIRVNALQESLKKVTLLSIKIIMFHIMILQIITLIIIIIVIITILIIKNGLIWYVEHNVTDQYPKPRLRELKFE